jgi:hypothetical protein
MSNSEYSDSSNSDLSDDYTYDDFSSYNLDKWIHIIDNVEFSDINGEEYKIAQSYELIKLEHEDVKYFIEYKEFNNEDLINKITNLFNIKPEYFFKLSSRSPKDILEFHEDWEIKHEDHWSVKMEKKMKQISVLKVTSYEDVMNLLKKSYRTKDDMKLYLQKYEENNQINNLYLVFEEWKNILGHGKEFRCFIRDYELIGICLFRGEYYSSRTTVPILIIAHFIKQMMLKLKLINMSRCVVDIFIPNNSNKVYFIEINPYDRQTATFNFDYDELEETEDLLITL